MTQCPRFQTYYISILKLLSTSSCFKPNSARVALAVLFFLGGEVIYAQALNVSIPILFYSLKYLLILFIRTAFARRSVQSLSCTATQFRLFHSKHLFGKTWHSLPDALCPEHRIDFDRWRNSTSKCLCSLEHLLSVKNLSSTPPLTVSAVEHSCLV